MSDQAKGPNATKADKNPKGGLSAAGRKKFGVQKGVTNYSSASRKDKGRWVSWAMRFTGSPKPVKDDKGNPTRYALMFRAWGEPVPTSADAVKAVHAKAVKRSAELKNADKADLEPGTIRPEAFHCDDQACEDRYFRVFDSLLNHIDTVHLGGTTTTGGATMRKHDNAYAGELVRQAKSEHAPGDLAGLGLETAQLVCRDADCGRTFRGVSALRDHAEAVHTFSDIQSLLSETIREKYGRRGDYRAEPPIPSIYAWISDVAPDWVVFSVEGDGKDDLYKAAYSIDANNAVTLGEPVAVVRRTVYDPVTVPTLTANA